MKRTLGMLFVFGLLVAGGYSVAALASPPPSPPGQDPCAHGNSSQPCRTDPQPSHGKDCDPHGQNGGVNEDHCAGTTGTTTTDTSPNTGTTNTTTTENTTTTGTSSGSNPTPSSNAAPSSAAPTPTAQVAGASTSASTTTPSLTPSAGKKTSAPPGKFKPPAIRRKTVSEPIALPAKARAAEPSVTG
jgi:hypothetical protein